MRYHKEVRHLSFFELCFITNSFWPECVTVIVSGPRLHHWQLLTTWIFQKLYQERVWLIEIVRGSWIPSRYQAECQQLNRKPSGWEWKRHFSAKALDVHFLSSMAPPPGCSPATGHSQNLSHDSEPSVTVYNLDHKHKSTTASKSCNCYFKLLVQ